jgi:predicted O-linked N-acetylglucosamine transferase (SPINDLY family)
MRLRSLGVDIAIDLCGHTEGSRPGILQLRPAPVQVNYLGFAGTMGADFIDYIVADRIVLPFDQQPHYSERIVHLPDCFLVSDATKAISAHSPSRREAGLPEQGFVFCCFNNSYKISAAVFDVWMRLLKRVEGSVLWLSQMGDRAAQNLRAAARARDVDPPRIVFAPRVQSMADHLARHRLADLFVDTPGYNAHTTASDALWAGLPVMTCLGSTFAGRVAASLLYAVGLPELVTDSMEDYEALALKLARDPALLQSLRQRLADNRRSQPLFDTDRFRRSIETAYGTMLETWKRGDAPQSFSVSEVGR